MFYIFIICIAEYKVQKFLILHILSFNYLEKSFGAFLTLNFSYNISTSLRPFDFLLSTWCYFFFEFSIIG